MAFKRKVLDRIGAQHAAVTAAQRCVAPVDNHLHTPLVKSVSDPSLAKASAPIAWVGSARVPFSGQDLTQVVRFEDSDDYLLSPRPFDFSLYVVCLEQQGVSGIDLIRLIRRRSQAGVLALGDSVADGVGDGFVAALDAGADMLLGPTTPATHLQAAIRAVRRRVGSTKQLAPDAPWRLLEAQAILQAPDGTQISLGESDLVVMRCFALAEGGRVARRDLIDSLWGKEKTAMDNALHVTLHRLRKRIEQSGQAMVPVHSVSKMGYEFRAPLVRG